MKTRRIASSIALAAAVALGATSCGLMVPQNTTQTYAPSDGIDVNVGDLMVRNLMLIADESGKNFNVVFTGVNNAADSGLLRITFVSDDGAAEASADFLLEQGITVFGDPNGDVAPVLVTIPNLKPGATVKAYFEGASGSEELSRQVPVLDGSLFEYADYVLSPSQLVAEEDVELGGEDQAEDDAADSEEIAE